MGMKRRAKPKFDPWYKMKPEDYSCSVPWDTEWKHWVPGKEVLPMPGILRFLEQHPDGRRFWQVVGHYNGCGHWSEETADGEMCGTYGGRESAVGALTSSAHMTCWNCLMNAWEPILKTHREREKTNAQETER